MARLSDACAFRQGLKTGEGESMPGARGVECPGPGTTTARRSGPSRMPSVAQFWNGVFSAKYSWLSALSTALVGLLIARFFAPVWP
jgi:hypothetical protein